MSFGFLSKRVMKCEAFFGMSALVDFQASIKALQITLVYSFLGIFDLKFNKKARNPSLNDFSFPKKLLITFIIHSRNGINCTMHRKRKDLLFNL